MHDHTLIIGGTGMLLAASVALARRSRALTSVARTDRSLAALDGALAGIACVHHRLPLDWTRADFLPALSEHLERVGRPSLVVAWLHDERLGPEIARRAASADRPCSFFQVLGSAAADPAHGAPDLAAAVSGLPGVDYHLVILGFRIEGGGRRWLRDQEISDGVLAAIALSAPICVVGTVAHPTPGMLVLPT